MALGRKPYVMKVISMWWSSKTEEVDDAELMAGVCRKNPKDFQCLFDRHKQPLMAFLLRMHPNESDLVQDLAQETFARVWEKPHLFNPEYKFKTWLFTIASNLSKSEWRKMQVRGKVHAGGLKSDEVKQGSSDTAPDVQVDLNLFSHSLQEALLRLDESHRNVFLLRYQQEFSIKEISEVLEVPEGTVKSRLFYAVKKLGGMLKHLQPIYQSM